MDSNHSAENNYRTMSTSDKKLHSHTIPHHPPTHNHQHGFAVTLCRLLLPTVTNSNTHKQCVSLVATSVTGNETLT